MVGPINQGHRGQSNFIKIHSILRTIIIRKECFDHLASITTRGENISQYDSRTDQEQKI